MSLKITDSPELKTGSPSVPNPVPCVQKMRPFFLIHEVVRRIMKLKKSFIISYTNMPMRFRPLPGLGQNGHLMAD